MIGICTLRLGRDIPSAGDVAVSSTFAHIRYNLLELSVFQFYGTAQPLIPLRSIS